MNLPQYRGTFSRDRLPVHSNDIESFIVNLDSYKNRGTHWVAIKKYFKKAYYYDSFGVEPPLEILKYLKGCEIIYNIEQHQQFDTYICGQLCLKFLSEPWSP